MALNRDKEGRVIVHRVEQDDEIVITEELIGMIGYAQNSGYLGSSIYLTLNYNPFTEEEIKDIFKQATQERYTLHKENEKTLIVEFMDIRRLLDEEGMHYRRGTRNVPKFLLTGPESQRKSYVKGFILGSLDQDAVDELALKGSITIHPGDYDTANAIRKLIEEDGGEVTLDPSEVTLHLPPNKLTKAFTNQNITKWTEGL